MVRTGYYFAVGPALVAVLLGWFGLWGFATISFLLAGFVLFFFRDPERTIPTTPGAIVSPADGRVISVDQTDLLGSSHTRISIFLSVFDVHVNRAPIEGTVDDIQYRAGRFHIASHDQASHENEQNEVTMAGEGTRVVFRQIAGVLARRIEFWKKFALARGWRYSFRPTIAPGFDPTITCRGGAAYSQFENERQGKSPASARHLRAPQSVHGGQSALRVLLHSFFCGGNSG
jgi:phosphatidylserine decarboxylase